MKYYTLTFKTPNLNIDEYFKEVHFYIFQYENTWEGFSKQCEYFHYIVKCSDEDLLNLKLRFDITYKITEDIKFWWADIIN
jgi:hypothetical protein